MKIGLDIDNVILETDEEILKEMIKEDTTKRNKGIVNPEADYIFLGMFDWTKDEIDEFLNKKMEDIAKKLKAKENAKYFIDKLIEEGHEIYLISNRSSKQYRDAYHTTKDNLKLNDIKYTKLIITETNDKTKECLDEEIDIMVDDRPRNCFKLIEKNINCLLFKTKYEKREFNNLKSVSSWSELYETIKNSTK